AGWPWNTGWYDKAHVRPSPLNLTQAALHGGLVASMVYYHGVRRNQTFVVDVASLREALRLSKDANAGMDAAAVTGQAPDVGIVLSESFMDPRVMTGMGELPDLIPNVRRQLDAGHGGMMLAPTFGGGTVRTEFEVLTGMPAAAFPSAHYPYVDLSPQFIPGIVSVLEK